MKVLHLIIIGISFFSCKPDPIVVPEPEPEDCRYQFPEDLSGIEGAWEAIQITDAETGEVTADEDGYIGFMIESDRYCDAFELRPTGEFDLYYKRDGRHCEGRNVGNWVFENDTIYFDANEEILKVEVINVAPDTLLLKDIVDFKLSVVKMIRAD